MPPQTRFDDEQNSRIDELKAIGHKKIMFKAAAKEVETYDVKKGRSGRNESLPEEVPLERVLPKPPALALLYVYFRRMHFSSIHGDAGTNTKGPFEIVFLPLLLNSSLILRQVLPNMSLTIHCGALKLLRTGL